MQELLDRLQQSGAGCHIGSTFLGATAWADDFLLTAPTRGSMQQMLDIASHYAAEVGLQFSTDPDQAKSKSKAVFMVGRKRDLVKPAPLVLSGKALPYVAHATHLGHEFHKSGSMEMDTRMRRGAYSGRSLEIQEAFSFAAPAEVLAAIKLYCCDLHGGMLARRDAGQSPLSGPSPEVATLARVAAADQRTTTAENNRLVYSLTGLDARVATAAEVRTELRRREPDMTENEEKTAGLLCQALQARNWIWMEGLNTTGITAQIDNLCVN